MIKWAYECSALRNDFSTKMGNECREKENSGENCEGLMLRAIGNGELWENEPEDPGGFILSGGAMRVQRFSGPLEPHGIWEVFPIPKLYSSKYFL